MRTLHELTSTPDPAWPLVSQWIVAAQVPVEVLPPSDHRDQVLLDVQVTTHSTLGAIGYEAGGLLIDHGWLRLLGSGHPRLTRTLPSWNAQRASGFYLVGDDVAGGFYAINGDAFGEDHGNMYYLAPDRLIWEPMAIGYSQFVRWCMSERLSKYYETLRWPTWKEDVSDLHSDRCFFWYPPLWTKEGGVTISRRGEIPVSEAWDLSLTLKAQLDGPRLRPATDSTPLANA